MLSVCSISIVSIIHSHTNACSVFAQFRSSLSDTHTNACSVSAQFLSSVSYTHTQMHAQCLINFCHTLNNSRSCFHSAHKKTMKRVYIHTSCFVGERSQPCSTSALPLPHVKVSIELLPRPQIQHIILMRCRIAVDLTLICEIARHANPCAQMAAPGRESKAEGMRAAHGASAQVAAQQTWLITRIA